MVARVDAVGLPGSFLFVTPANGAICPRCGELVERIWEYHPEGSTTWRPVACDRCLREESDA